MQLNYTNDPKMSKVFLMDLRNIVRETKAEIIYDQACLDIVPESNLLHIGERQSVTI